MSTIALDGPMPRTRTTDPTTSVDAGRGANLPESQHVVLVVFIKARRPLADHQLVAWVQSTVSSNLSPSRIRSARAELTEAGVIVETGEFVKTPRGYRAHLWGLA